MGLTGSTHLLPRNFTNQNGYWVHPFIGVAMKEASRVWPGLNVQVIVHKHPYFHLTGPTWHSEKYERQTTGGGLQEGGIYKTGL